MPTNNSSSKKPMNTKSKQSLKGKNTTSAAERNTSTAPSAQANRTLKRPQKPGSHSKPTAKRTHQKPDSRLRSSKKSDSKAEHHSAPDKSARGNKPLKNTNSQKTTHKSKKSVFKHHSAPSKGSNTHAGLKSSEHKGKTSYNHAKGMAKQSRPSAHPPPLGESTSPGWSLKRIKPIKTFLERIASLSKKASNFIEEKKKPSQTVKTQTINPNHKPDGDLSGKHAAVRHLSEGGPSLQLPQKDRGSSPKATFKEGDSHSQKYQNRRHSNLKNHSQGAQVEGPKRPDVNISHNTDRASSTSPHPRTNGGYPQFEPLEAPSGIAKNPTLPYLESIIKFLSEKKVTNFSSLLKAVKLSFHSEKALFELLTYLQKYHLVAVAKKQIKYIVRPLKGTKYPKYALIKIKGFNTLGEPVAQFISSAKQTKSPDILVQNPPSKKLLVNDLIIAKISKADHKTLKAITLSVVPKFEPTYFVALVQQDENGGTFLLPITRKLKDLFNITNKNKFDLQHNTLVKAQVITKCRAASEAEIISILSNQDLTQNLALLTAYEFELSTEFPEDVNLEAQKIAGLPANAAHFKDLTSVPFVTIDGPDAKDFDDAVYVEPINDPAKPDGYKILVAIADVSSYVKLGNSLDTEALKRGNSTYLPGLVVPMLPNILSTTWCSLNPHEERAALVAELQIDAAGHLQTYHFYKAIIKSHARLTYHQVDELLAGKQPLEPLNTRLSLAELNLLVQNLNTCWQTLSQSRSDRGALNIQPKEFEYELSADNTLTDITLKPQLNSYKIIEELMVLANVAAAKFLQDHNLASTAVYRVHDKPTAEKLFNFENEMRSLGVKVVLPKHLSPKYFNQFLTAHPKLSIINDFVRSAQSQALYSTYNIGHFGLALENYIHFTSPIRRYADLITHHLISWVLAGKMGQPPLGKEQTEPASAHISTTERISAAAEYSAKEKLSTQWLSTKLGEEFEATIVNITSAGLFVSLDEVGVQGLTPMRTLGHERFFIRKNKTLANASGSITFSLGESIRVRLIEANVIKGLITFSLAD